MLTNSPTKISTKAYGWCALGFCLIGYVLDALSGSLWVHWHIHGRPLDYIGGGLFWLGYALLWILLPVSLFRPNSRFYMTGDCCSRASMFGFTALLLLAAHALIIWSIYTAFGR
jgi:hypothetical protein